MDSILHSVMETASEAQSSPDDYIAPDGLKYCGKCHTPKEAFFPKGSHFGNSDRYPILCKCAAEKEARKKAQQQEAERMERISQLHSEAFQDIPALNWRFENAAVMTCNYPKSRAMWVIGRLSEVTASGFFFSEMSGRGNPMPQGALRTP
ncbi:MAG: hypothetical protein LUG49_07530 [Oscillospiraceae bacterium]|nr:hypothetical protein [Oscillospiraceae bacterium]